MMNEPRTFPEIENLLGELLKGELTPEQGARFVEILDGNTAALDEYLRLIFVTAFLRESQRHPAGDNQKMPQPPCGQMSPGADEGIAEPGAVAERWHTRIRRVGMRFLRAG